MDPQELKKILKNLIEEIEKGLSHPPCADHPEYITSMAKLITSLGNYILKLQQTKSDENHLLSHILKQPLDILGSEGISLFKAATALDPQDIINSDMRKILLSFLRFPDETKILLRELKQTEKKIL